MSKAHACTARHAPASWRTPSPFPAASLSLDPSPTGCRVTTTRLNCAYPQRGIPKSTTWLAALHWSGNAFGTHPCHLCGGPQICARALRICCGSLAAQAQCVQCSLSSARHDHCLTAHPSYKVPPEPRMNMYVACRAGAHPPDHAASPQISRQVPARSAGVCRGAGPFYFSRRRRYTLTHSIQMYTTASAYERAS